MEQKSNEELKKNNAGDTRQNEESQQENNKQTTSAAAIDAIITSPTEAVRSRMSGGNLGSTGTNVSYEGETAEGGAGSAGTGYNDDQTGSGISTSSHDAAEDAALSRKAPGKQEDETLGNP
jgi:hypothetical protein